MEIKDKNGKKFKTYTVAKDDYPELEGKIIDYDYSSGKVVKALIVGCNRSVGITIVEVNDKDKYALCYHGPVSPTPSDFSKKACTWDEFFDTLIKMFQEGHVDTDKLDMVEFGKIQTGMYCDGNCAYSQ